VLEIAERPKGGANGQGPKFLMNQRGAAGIVRISDDFGLRSRWFRAIRPRVRIGMSAEERPQTHYNAPR